MADTISTISESTRIAVSVVLGVTIAFVLAISLFFFWRCRNLEESICSLRQELYCQLENNSDLTAETVSKSTRKQGIVPIREWRAPLTMIWGLLSGLGFALIHHFFYLRLSSVPVDNAVVSQSWNLRLGNLLAFLVKLSFAISIATAFVQWQWLKVRQQAIQVKQFDDISGILGNILNFKSRVWLRFPILTLLAMIFWVSAIIPIITPGTLNVIPIPHKQALTLQVPYFNDDDTVLWWYGGPLRGEAGEAYQQAQIGSGLSQSILAAAFGGEITPLQPQHANQSFHMDFYGPALSCSPVNSSTITGLIDIFAGFSDDIDNLNDESPGYVSWVGGDMPTSNFSETPGSIIDVTSMDAAKLYVMTWGDNMGVPTIIPNITVNEKVINIPNITECSLRNASYSLDFEYINSIQAISSNVTLLNGVTWISATTNYYAGLMAGLGSIMVGSNIFATASTGYQAGPVVRYTQSGLLHIDIFDAIQLKKGLEELFYNITVSILASNPANNFTVVHPVPGTATFYLTTYSYNQLDLILAYSIAFMCTLFCWTFGFYAFLANNGSYQNILSTFIRATNHAHLVMDDHDMGKDPCPKAFSRAIVYVNRRRGITVRSPRSSSRQGGSERKMIPRSATILHHGHKSRSTNDDAFCA